MFKHRVSIILSFLLLISVFLSASADQLKDPYQILQKHFKMIGGLEKLKAEKTAIIDGTISIQNGALKGTFKRWTQYPMKSRQEVDLKIMKQINGDTGEISWNIDANGKYTEVKDQETLIRRQLSEYEENYEYLNPDSKIYTLVLDGVENVGERKCYVIKVTNSLNSDWLKRYIDTENFRELQQVNSLGNNTITASFSDFREVSGVLRPFRTDIEVAPLGQKIVNIVTDYKVNLGIPENMFKPVIEKEKDYRFISGDRSENIKIDFSSYHIYIKVKINGHEDTWILDTGAGRTVIDSAYAEKIGLKTEGSTTGQGAGNQVNVSFVDLPPFELGGLQFDSQKIVAIDLHDILYRKIGIKAAGILGYDFLSRVITKVDYANNLVSFYEPDTFQYKGDGKILDFELKMNHINVKAGFNGSNSGDWILDTGAGGTMLTHSAAAEAKLIDKKGVDMKAAGAGGEFVTRAIRIDSLEFSDFKIDRPVIDFPLEQQVGVLGSVTHKGIIGNDVLQKFVIYFDYKNNKLILEKGKNFDNEMPAPRTGMQLELNDNGEVIISTIAKETPAESAGFKAGDVITGIDGKTVDEAGGLAALRRLFLAAEGTEYKISILRNGEKLTIDIILKNIV